MDASPLEFFCLVDEFLSATIPLCFYVPSGTHLEISVSAKRHAVVAPILSAMNRFRGDFT